MNSPEDWWRRTRDKEAVAVLFKDDEDHALEAWDACGLAAEFALKAVIHRRGGFGRWPDRVERPELHTHDLGRLMVLAALRPDDLPPHIRPSFKMVLSWSIGHRYSARPFPRDEARQMFEATFGNGGVVPWLRSL